MRISIIAILVSISAMCFGQAAPDSTIQLDTITPTELSRQSLESLLYDIRQLQSDYEASVKFLQEKGKEYNDAMTVVNRYNDLSAKIMLIVNAYVENEHFGGFTPDNLILKK